MVGVVLVTALFFAYFHPVINSAMRKLLLICLTLFPILSFSQYVNIEVGNQYAPNEPSIAINPKAVNEMIAGANLRNYYLSSDSGNTWTQHQLSSTLGVWGDPVMAIDTVGDYYFFHLSNPQVGHWIDRIVCQKSTDKGLTWNDGTYVGLNGTKQQDKQWVTIDRENNYIYMTWTEFDDYGSTLPSDSSRILFSKSVDAGLSWSTPLILSKNEGNCIDSDETVEGAVPTIGPNGEIYVAWSGDDKIWFNKSTDTGNTWLPSEIRIANQPGGWDYEISGVSRCNGMPITMCDTSQNSTRGNIYVLWSDQRNGLLDTDVWIIKSTNNGVTWTLPKRVNDDGIGSQQFMTWGAVDQSTGVIYTIFYDRRNYTISDETDVYMAYSTDGGETFTNVRISDTAFVPNSNLFFGDYTGIQAVNGTVRPIWTKMHQGEQTIQTALIQHDPLTGVLEIKREENLFLEQNFPNPVEFETQIAFKLRETSVISITVYDMYGRAILTPIINQEFTYGRHQFTINIGDIFSSGIYYYRLSSVHENVTRKMIIK